MSFGVAIARAAIADPDAIAVTCGADRLTRDDLHRRSDGMAHVLATVGVESGNLVTVALPNSIEFFVACSAIWKLGAIPQPVSGSLPPRELTAILEVADPAAVVGVDPITVAPRPAISRGFASADLTRPFEAPYKVSPSWKAPTSGGSTGRPKVIVSSEPAIVEPAGPDAAVFGQAGCFVIPGPLYHNFPFSVAMKGVVFGNHVVVLPKFDAELTLRAVAESGATHLVLVPTMMQRIWRLPDDVRMRYDLSSLLGVWHTAAPCPPWLKEAWIDWLGGERLFELYAGTEGQAQTRIRGDEWLSHRGSVGKVTAGEMKISGPGGEVLGPGEVGEIYMRSGQDGRPMYHYVGAEAKSLDDHWESLGDIGYIDGDGYVYLLDRLSDMILCGGANIYPAEVEEAILEHPRVMSCAVVGLPDEDLGNRIHAIVQLDQEVTVNSLRSFVAERLVRYKVPRSFEFVSSPVRDDAGKVRRSRLREERSTPKVAVRGDLARDPHGPLASS